MKDILKIVFFCAALTYSIWLKAETKSPTERFSWVDTDFVRQGYRNAPWLYDPFYPTDKKFSLRAIIAPDRAYINGKWLRKGEEIDGYKIKEIRTATVVLVRRSEVVQLKIKE